ncbi:MAG: cupin domain-containing protein [Proteobacteria bacterium]|nr:cupin domain-containing protein [Pseudomonadota bacterium]
MEVRNRGSYEIEARELVAEGRDLRVQVLTLAAGQRVPWHKHSEVTDSFVCLEGDVVIETRLPTATTMLQPGQRFAVKPGIAHMVRGKDGARCKFMIIQGVGVYDFIATSE